MSAQDPYAGWYNGFTLAERRAANPLLRTARASGLLEAPKTCSVCSIVQSVAAPIRMEWHLEDYRVYLQPYAICHGCHWALHARFERPQRWAKLISQCPDNSWVHKLTTDPASKGRPFDQTYPEGLSGDS